MALKKEVKEVIKMSLDLMEYERKQIVVALMLSMLNDIPTHDVVIAKDTFGDTADDLLRYMYKNINWGNDEN